MGETGEVGDADDSATAEGARPPAGGSSIDVVVPAYNHERFIERCLRSVFPISGLSSACITPHSSANAGISAVHSC